MEAIVFSVLGAAACGFLIYVFAQFHREIVRLRTVSTVDSHLIYLGTSGPEPDLSLVTSYAQAGEKPQAKTEAVVRREMLISGILALVGLLAPLIFVMLLTSSGRWHH
jgi:hypothetical protein